MVESGQIDGYSNKELAEMLDCSPRTVEAYLRDYGNLTGGQRVVQRSEYELPLLTTRGMKLYDHKGMDDCKKCPMYEICKEQVRLGNFVACEMPLAKEVYSVEDIEEMEGEE